MDPIFEGYQLVGDSILLRFAEQLLGLKRKRVSRYARIGLCVSGQTMGDLRCRLPAWDGVLARNVILMIGTNDVLKKTNLDLMLDEIYIIIEYLKERTDHLIILTIPPVPKLMHRHMHWRRVEELNSRIRSLSGQGVTVCNVGAAFHRRRSPIMKFYERFYGRTSGRRDMIHPNRKGLQEMQRRIRKCL